MKHIPPRWFSGFTLLLGLYVLGYLIFDEVGGGFLTTLVPTGILAIILIVAGCRWTFGARSRTPRN